MDNKIFDVIILGAGPAGLAAGIYASRAKLSTLILNEGAIGGQLTLTNEIANYPGVETTSGYSLVTTMKKQAKEFGCKIKSNKQIASFNINGKTKNITVNKTEIFEGKTVILATGGTPRMLDIPGEKIFKGKGVSYCATCDGDFFTNKEIVVIGGGNSALEEAVALTNFASKVTVVHQFAEFQAFEFAIQEAKQNPKISFIMESEPREIIGGESVKSIKIEHLPTGKTSEIKTDGIFIFIGYVPNTDKLKNKITLNNNGEIIVDADMNTNIPGVFAAGDSIHKKFRQVTTAVADGTIAALSAAAYVRQ